MFKIWKITGLRNRINVITFHSLGQLVVHQSPLDMSHCHGHQHKYGICINVFCKLLWSPLLVLLFNFSRVVIIALVIGLHQHIHLLEC